MLVFGGRRIRPRYFFGGSLFGEKMLEYLMWVVVGGPR